MKKSLAVGCLVLALGALAVSDVAYAAGRTQAVVTRHCGSFKYGSDGSSPGPSDITATGVTCRFARALAFRGGAAGWRCRLPLGLRFVCRPRQGHGKVTFFGE